MTELINTELIDITEQIIPDKEPKFFNDEEALEIYETCIHLMEEFIKDNPKLISEPDFDDIFDENITELMHAHFDFDIFYTEDAQEEMEEIIEHAKNDFFKEYIPLRSYPDTIILKEPDFEYVKSRLYILRNKPQPAQRTKEWYEFRHGILTASNIYKTFESQSTRNQLIYEKCKPLNQQLYIDSDEDEDEKEILVKEVSIKDIVMVNVNTTLHWGNKYEPLSVKLYEYLYNTKVEDFGCLKHDIYTFLGASPDGINNDPTSQRYGRMLEIKNIVNREINGIPKKEYWIQMQQQMEVCQLDECDFLETRFTEYPDYISYKDDTLDEYFEDEDGIECLNICLSKDNKIKGQFIYFHTKEGTPVYIYKPLEITHHDDIKEWQEYNVDYYQHTPEFKYTYMKTIYWKLDQISCVLVCRNRKWFKDVIDEIKELWTTIEKERVSGYEHRAPNRKQKKESILDFTTKPSGGCLLQFNKETGKITVNKQANKDDSKQDSKQDNIQDVLNIELKN